MAEPTSKATYISLAEAAQHSPYSQEYLSLRARQGKLRAIKRGRNWVTTLGWLDDYLHQVDEAKTELKQVSTVAPQPASLSHSHPHSEPDPEFAFHPVAAQQRQSKLSDTQEQIGSLLVTDQESKTSNSATAWQAEDFQPEAFSREVNALFSRLQTKTEEAVHRETEEPVFDKSVIDLAFDEMAARDAAVESMYVELGTLPEREAQSAFFEQTEERVSRASRYYEATVPAHTHGTEDFFGAIMSVVRPALAVAAVFVFFVSVLIFNKPLNISRNIALGAATMLEGTSSALIALGQTHDTVTGAGQVDRASVAQQSFGTVEASELYGSEYQNSTGRVAGAEVERPGIWQSIVLGFLTVLGR